MTKATGPVDVEAVGSLPADDPLREALAERARADDELCRAWDAAEEEEEALRAALRDVEVPADLQRRLEAVPHSGRAVQRRLAWSAVYLAAAAVLAVLILRPWQASAPSSSPDLTADAIARTDAEPSLEAATATDAKAEGPKILAVKFWHRTCPACKVLDPVYADVVERLETEPVLWVTFDMSTEFSRGQSALLASALGIRALYDDRFGSSGYVVLLDAQTLEPIGELTTKDARDMMIQRVQEAVARS